MDPQTPETIILIFKEMYDMDKVRIGIIGAGQIAKAHLEMYRDIPDAEVTAICALNEDNLKMVAQKWDIPHIYTDYRELLKRDDIVAVDVCLHNNLHMPVTIDAFREGKHVYCEKPLAGSYADGAKMVGAAKQYGKMLHIQLSSLYTPETRAARRLIDGGALGRIYHARSVGFRRRGRPYVDGYGTEKFVQKKYAGGGAIYDMAVYHISQLLYLMGMPQPQTISGKLYQETDMHEGRRKQSGYDVEELGLGFVRFSNGITMDIFESWAVHMGNMESSSLMGSKGGIRLKPFSYHTTICDVDLDCTGNLENMNFRWMNTIEDEYAYSSSQAHWIAALKGEVPLLPTAELALCTMLIQEGLYLSDKVGSEVTAQEVIDNSVSTAVEV